MNIGHRRSVTFLAIVLLCAFCGFNFLFSTGIVGVTQKPNHVFETPGCFCHADTASVNVQAWIEGPDSVGAGQVALFWMHVAKESSVAAGFNVAAFFGDLGIVDSVGTQRMYPTPTDSAELTHVLPKPFSGSDTISWPFYYRAPLTTGVIDTMYSNGNSVDLTGDTFGDEWTFSPNFLVYVTPPSHVPDETRPRVLQLFQNYPNPFNPSTTISFSLSHSEEVTVKVYDIIGNEIATLAGGAYAAGDHAVEWNASGNSSGIYLVVLTTSQQSIMRKVVLMK
ncbi:MAG: T9SS type A sorting domain-containing protein [Bacteroidota bacterium]